MKPYKIQNRSDVSRRVKLQKNDGSINFVTTPQDNYVENSREVGFCLQPIDPLIVFNTTTDSIELSSLPIGVNGRISLFINDTLEKSIRYVDTNTLQDRINFFSTEFGSYVTWLKQPNDTFIFNIASTNNYIRLVFEDDDIDYLFNEFSQTTSTNPTLIVEQYRLSFDLKMSTMISCVGAKEAISFLHYSELIESGAICTLITDSFQNTVNLRGGTQRFIDDFNQNFSDYTLLSSEDGTDLFNFNINTNVNAEVRIQLTIPWDFSSIQEVPFDGSTMNGTSVIVGGNLSFCLAKQSSAISCDGATSSIYFPLLEGFWDVQINDDYYELTGRTVAQFLQVNFEGIFNVTSDVGTGITNLDPSPFRFRLIPLSETNYTSPTDNPTFSALTDGSLVFCLAPTQVEQDLYTPAVQALNPIAYYLMSDESGATITDSSESMFNAVVNDYNDVMFKSPALRAGSGGSMGFNIASNWTTAECYVSDATAGDTFKKLAAVGKSCTITFWFKPIAVRPYNFLAAYILNKDFGTANYRLMAYNDTSLLGQSPANQNQVVAENYGLMIDNVQFVVWRKDANSGTYSLTVNGVSNTVIANSNDASESGQGFYFPMSTGYSSYGLRGYMSDMAVFDYALTDAQISDLYQKGQIL